MHASDDTPLSMFLINTALVRGTLTLGIPLLLVGGWVYAERPVFSRQQGGPDGAR